jgi:hypothetical protein
MGLFKEFYLKDHNMSQHFEQMISLIGIIKTKIMTGEAFIVIKCSMIKIGII